MLTMFAAAALASAVSAANCTALSGFVLDNARITSAELVPEGVFLAPASAGQNANTDREPIPTHCRVKIVLTPSAQSNINVELWLPAGEWNGRFLAVGNGGWAGAIQGYNDMRAALRRGSPCCRARCPGWWPRRGLRCCATPRSTPFIVRRSRRCSPAALC